MTACEDLAERMGVRVVRESLPSAGGLCRLKGEWRLYLDADLDAEETLDAFCQALSRFDLNDAYVLPALREEIERRGGAG